MTVTEKFIEYLYACNDKLPPRILKIARSCLIDYLGVAYAGSVENGRILSTVGDASGKCSVFGSDKKADVLTAAFLNGYSAHLLELDDGHRYGAIHLGAVIISAILAAAQNLYSRESEFSLEPLLRGIVIGYEAAVRCAISMQPGHKKRGYHTSGTCGTIGAAVGIGIMLRFGRERMKSTISGAATSAAGFLEIQENASEMKPYNIGHAAMSGVMAATIGEAGVCSPNDILGGPRGVLRVMTDTFREVDLYAEAEGFEIERIYFKPYAACRHCHAAMEAAIKLRNTCGLEPEDIRKISVYTYEQAVRGHDHIEIEGVPSAKLSIPYSVAAAYIFGHGGLEAFSKAAVTDRCVLSLTKRVQVIASDEFTRQSPEKRISEVQIFTDKDRYTYRVDYAKGDPENPMTEEERNQKFIQMMDLAQKPKLADEILSLFAQGKENTLLQII